MGHFVFVYGTLKLGECNHLAYLKGATFVSPAKTVSRYKMVDTGGFPAVLDYIQRLPVQGEVYEVSAGTLAALDRLEGHPNFFRRKEVSLTFPDCSHFTAWMYLGTPGVWNDLMEAPIRDNCYVWWSR